MTSAWAPAFAGLGLALGLISPIIPLVAAAPPEPAAVASLEPEPRANATVVGRVIEAGGRRIGVAGATVMIVDAPASARPGKHPRVPLDPEAIAWIREAQTDADGTFVIDEVPIGKVRVIIVAAGYARLEQWENVPLADRDDPLKLYIKPQAGEYRTEVHVERPRPYAVAPEHVLDGQEARRYAGSGGDPLIAAQNLPGIARSPAGFGLIGFRGGDPNEAGFYLDGHPVPRSFHVLPIASVLSPPMVGRMQLSPGNYSAAYGGFGGGLVEMESRPGRREGIHGQAHIDLFDVGAALEGPVGDGSVHVGVRRSHVGDVLDALVLPIGSPRFWDYLGRFDHPLPGGRELTLRALGAGDRLAAEYFDFNSSFHRFDLDYRRTHDRWRVLLSPSLRLDSTHLRQESTLRRDARVYSLRAAFTRFTVVPWVRLEFGADAVAQSWRRRATFTASDGFWPPTPGQPTTIETAEGTEQRFGAWLSIPMTLGDWQLTPSIRANLFTYTGYPSFRLDPRVDLRGLVHPKLEAFAGLGMYSTPVVTDREARGGIGPQWTSIGDGVADIPEYLITYFLPTIPGAVDDRVASPTYVIHASAGVEATLPWQLKARATGFWREGLPKTLDPGGAEPLYHGRRRSMGLELLVRRSLVAGVLDGWIGYTLMSARIDRADGTWMPAIFDQRHNFVALLSANLPRGFRLGLRFRAVSGNPETPIVGRHVSTYGGDWYHIPIRGERGTSYEPMFHQLDLRIDKRWTRDRTSVTLYLDVQNVYNNIYPELWIYTTDWSSRAPLIGLPIYPSLGVLVDF